MPHYIAFLRGINLGKRRVVMSRLKSLFVELGYSEVSTFIASGNVLFTAREKNTAKLENQISRHLEKSLGYEVDTFVRTRAEVVTVAQAEVFKIDEGSGISVYVAFLQNPLAAEIAQRLSNVRTETDEIKVIGREYYWLCKIRSSDSKVWSSKDIKALRLPTSTMRNITSLRKLVASFDA
jgi:uncharacterized protein (DUF1697 family)